MKVARLVIGIISIVLFLVVTIQSCAAGFIEAVEEDTKSTASAAGILVALILLVTGIVAICTKNRPAGGFICGSFYTIAGIIGLARHGMYKDLIVWASISLAFALVFFITGVVMLKNNDTNP